MSKLRSILTALALGTVPCVGGAAICVGVAAVRALWPVPAAVSATSAHLNGVLDGLHGVEGNAGAAIVTESGRLNRSLDNLDLQAAAVGPAVRKIDPVLANLKDDTAKLGRSIDLVNAPCAPGPCGTLADVGKTLNTARGTFGQIEIAANHENRNLGTLDFQEATLFGDFHGTAVRANTSLDRFNALLANPNLALMVDNGGAFTTTAVAVEKKLAQCTLHPTLPCVLKSDILFGAQVGGYLLK
jgi:hypothetical protein